MSLKQPWFVAIVAMFLLFISAGRVDAQGSPNRFSAQKSFTRGFRFNDSGYMEGQALSVSWAVSKAAEIILHRRVEVVIPIGNTPNDGVFIDPNFGPWGMSLGIPDPKNSGTMKPVDALLKTLQPLGLTAVYFSDVTPDRAQAIARSKGGVVIRMFRNFPSGDHVYWENSRYNMGVVWGLELSEGRDELNQYQVTIVTPIPLKLGAMLVSGMNIGKQRAMPQRLLLMTTAFAESAVKNSEGISPDSVSRIEMVEAGGISPTDRQHGKFEALIILPFTAPVSVAEPVVPEAKPAEPITVTLSKD